MHEHLSCAQQCVPCSHSQHCCHLFVFAGASVSAAAAALRRLPVDVGPDCSDRCWSEPLLTCCRVRCTNQGLVKVNPSVHKFGRTLPRPVVQRHPFCACTCGSTHRHCVRRALCQPTLNSTHATTPRRGHNMQHVTPSATQTLLLRESEAREI